jgi:AraC-like DNA-binding protein
MEENEMRGPKNRKDKTLTAVGGKRKSAAGRPKIVWDEAQWRQVDGMCAIQCTANEIAAVMDVSQDTLERLVKDEYGVNFAEFYERRSGRGKMSLRRMQWKSAEAGNVTMQIWLGRQMLDQKEKTETESIGRIEVVGDVPDGD